jgi:hypothetical protein
MRRIIFPVKRNQRFIKAADLPRQLPFCTDNQSLKVFSKKSFPAGVHLPQVTVFIPVLT